MVRGLLSLRARALCATSVSINALPLNLIHAVPALVSPDEAPATRCTMGPSLPRWTPRRTVIDLYNERDSTPWYWRGVATFSVISIMVGYGLFILHAIDIADARQLPHISFVLQTELLPHNNTSIVYDCSTYTPRPGLRLLPRNGAHLSILDLPSRHHIRSLPDLLCPRPHQCALHFVHTRILCAVDVCIHSCPYALCYLDPRIHYCSIA